MHIPLAVGLLDRQGRDLPLQLEGESAPAEGPTRVLALRKATESFRFVNVPHEPVPSLLRGFSAPVKLKTDLRDEELTFLLGHDSDAFNRWDAGQQLAITMMLGLIADHQRGKGLSLAAVGTIGRGFISAFAKTLENPELDRALVAEALTLPSEDYVAEFMEVIDPTAIHEVRDFLRRVLAVELKERFFAAYEANTVPGPYRFDAESAGQRRLKNLCLAYLMELDDPGMRRRCVAQLEQANNMTDVVSALALLANTDGPERTEALAVFYRRWKDDALVVDKWLSIQATSRLLNTLDEVKGLTQHPAFNLKNPNKVRALVGAFCHSNPARFHDASGAGYAFLADHVLRLNALNPQMAARLLHAMIRWRKYDAGRQALMRAQLERILATPDLSKDVYEIASKSLAQ